MAGNDFNTTPPIKSMPFNGKLKADEILRVRPCRSNADAVSLQQQ